MSKKKQKHKDTEAQAKSSPKAVAADGGRSKNATPPAVPAGAKVSTSDAAGRACGFVAVIGAPNAGKSTLVNALVGAKVSIVTHKVQTTRTAIRGIAMAGQAQLIFIDTPGIFLPKRRLDRAMVDTAWSSASDGDMILLLIDAVKGIEPDTDRILTRLANVRQPRLLAINKIDKVAKERLLELTAEVAKRVSFDKIFMISALSGDGVTDLKNHLASIAPAGPWHYADDDLSDLPVRLLAAEVTREKIFLRLHDELPYAITVETSDWKDFKDGSARIEQTIYVERDSQKQIVVGKGGQTIKQISMEARKDLGELIGQRVHLFLFVKVREHWSDDPERYREMGLNFPKS